MLGARACEEALSRQGIAGGTSIFFTHVERRRDLVRPLPDPNPEAVVAS